MARLARFSVLAGLALASTFRSGAASAHIDLLEPQPRYPNQVSGENKNCPCGVGTAGRGCSKPEERSDPNRSSDRQTELAGGSMVVVRLDEYVGHSGRYRIAFDPDGADLEDFNQHVLADIPDPRGSGGNIGEGSIWEIAAPLPNIDCDNCTLQVIQMMNGEMEQPVADPVGKSTYYQCADLVLTKDPSQPEGYPEPFIVLGEPELEEPAPEETPETNGVAGQEGARDAGDGRGDSSQGSAESDAVSPSSADSGGCGLRRPVDGGAHSKHWPLLALAGWALWISRRRARGPRSSVLGSRRLPR